MSMSAHGRKTSGWKDDAPDLSPIPNAEHSFEAAKRTRDRLLANESWFDSKEVAELAHRAVEDADAEQYASHLRSELRLLGVRWRGKYLHPAFQFQTSGEVHPAMERLLSALPITDANWNAAFWFFERNGKLGARRPADLFAHDPDAVVAAAIQDFVRDENDGNATSTVTVR